MQVSVCRFFSSCSCPVSSQATAEEALKQERTLFGHLLPSYSASAAPTSKGESPAANREPKRQRTRADEEAPDQQMIENQDKRKHKGKGRGQAKGKRGNADREVLKLMTSLTLQNVDQACRTQLETGFLLTLRNNTEAPECCLLPVMFRVSAAWRRAKEADPTSLDRPLRCSLMISLILELVARLERLQSDEALQKQAQELHWLTPDHKWQYRVWNPAAGGGTGALEVDTSRAPLTQEEVLEHLAQAQKLVLEASNLTRFQATRPLAEDMTGSHVAFLLDVGLRGRAAPLHKILNVVCESTGWTSSVPSVVLCFEWIARCLTGLAGFVGKLDTPAWFGGRPSRTMSFLRKDCVHW